MNTTISISVIVPIFNAEKYLRRCIESILASQFKDFEVILVNDGSVDRGLSICKWYEKKDRRVKLINQEHQGTAAARNRGIRESCGEWVVFVDSDDFISSDFFSLIVQKKYEGQDLLIFDFAGPKEWRYYRKKQIFQKKVFERKYSQHENPFLVECMLRCQQLMRDGRVDLRSVGAKAYKRAVIQKYFLAFPEGMVLGEDQIFQIEYQMKVKQCVYLKKSVYYVETRKDSVTQCFKPDTWKHYLYLICYLRHVLKSYPFFSAWQEAYYDAVLSNLKGILVMGIFHPQNPTAVRQKYRLCHRIRKLHVFENAVKFNRKTGDWSRKILFFFFRSGYYPFVKTICMIGHLRIKLRKR